MLSVSLSTHLSDSYQLYADFAILTAISSGLLPEYEYE